MKETDENEKAVKKVAGVRREPVKVFPKPYNPKLKFMSKAEFLEQRAKDNKANKAAELARQNSLAESGYEKEEDEDDLGQSPSVPVQDSDSQTLQQKVAGIKKSISETKKALAKDKRSPKLKSQLSKLEVELDETEDKLEEVETEK
jgi:hypothetical protein